MIADIFDHGALPALERMVQFTEARHRVLTNNIANLGNPYFKAADLDPKTFQAALSDAIDRRRGTGNGQGKLELKDTNELEFHPDGIEGRPTEMNESILMHDQSNVDIERNMQRLAENTLAHNTAIELVRNQFALIEAAIRERP